MNVDYKHTPYNYKFFNCSEIVLQYQKVHFFFKSIAQQNFLATGLFHIFFNVELFLIWFRKKTTSISLFHAKLFFNSIPKKLHLWYIHLVLHVLMYIQSPFLISLLFSGQLLTVCKCGFDVMAPVEHTE